MASSSYQIADTDELEAFGRDDDLVFDTSAALGPDDPVNATNDSQSTSKRRCCVCAVFISLSLAAVVTFIAVLFGARPFNSSSNGGSNSSPQDSSGEQNPDGKPPVFSVSVTESTPHDSNSFTQGFEFSNGIFFESTGLEQKSSLRKVEIDTGKVSEIYNFDDASIFGEGITLHGDQHVFMVSWKSGRGFIFNQSTLQLIKEWSYSGEGWGLAFDKSADEVYMSDGTTSLRVLDPETMNEKRRVKVTLDGNPVSNLNELEWICGEVWANVWLTKKIYRIDPQSGIVKSIIDAKNLPLAKDTYNGMDVLNGIAFDKDTGRLWLTGKLWKTVYQVTISDSSLDLKNCK